MRKKIEDDPTDPQYLHTVRGLGYCFRPPAWGAIMDLTPANLNALAAGQSA
ncbi:MAG: winged helix-turn-helix domain-containing protein [Thermomicrobiales bacterium]